MLRTSRFCRLLAVLGIALALMASLPQEGLALDSKPDKTDSEAVCITDTFGNVLYAYNENTELPPASITKVVTAMVVIDSGIPLDTPVEFVEQEYAEGAQLSGYVNGDTPTLGELLKVTMIYSGNDAAQNLALAVAGSNEAFAELMNAKVAEIGVKHTHFANPHGLDDEGQYSTAYDLCVIGRYALEHYPLIRDIVHTPSITIVADGKEVTLWSTDELMGNYDGLLGIKTGNLASGSSFLGAARRNHVTLYSCVLCNPTQEGRFEDTVKILDWGFSLYEQKSLMKYGWTLRMAPWQDGFWLTCPVGAARDVNGRVFPEGQLTYKTTMFKPSTRVSPGQVYGTTIWSQEGRLVEHIRYRAGASKVGNTAWTPLMLPAIKGTREA